MIYINSICVSTMFQMALTIRIKSKSGEHVLKNLSLHSTIDDLRSNIAVVTKFAPDTLRILKDFPPKPMDLTDGSQSLMDLKFKSGDTLIVEEDVKANTEKKAAVSQSVMNHVAEQWQNANGMLMRQVVPANNSCLFTSVHFVVENCQLDLNAAGPMRELIAGIVMSDPVKFDTAFLGKDNSEYCEWIMNEQSWGGAIELSILCQYHEIEIAVVDTQYVRINRFGEDQCFPQRVLLIYDGIHYDPLMLESSSPGVPAITKFSTQDESILSQALELAAEAKASRQFTDVQKFSLRCLVCQKALVGQTEAQAHAKQTGHINFGEF